MFIREGDLFLIERGEELRFCCAWDGYKEKAGEGQMSTVNRKSLDVLLMAERKREGERSRVDQEYVHR